MGMHAGHDAAQHPISGAPMTPLPFDMSVQNLHSQQQMHQWMASAHAEQRAQQSIADAKELAMQRRLQQLQHQIATLSAGTAEWFAGAVASAAAVGMISARSGLIALIVVD